MTGVARAEVVVPPPTDEQPDDGVPPTTEVPGTEPRLIQPTRLGPGDDLPRQGHSGQGGLALSLPIGLRTIAPFDSEYCGKSSTETGSGNAAVCVDRAPVAIDLALSYGLGDKLELLVELRLGLESDFSSLPGRSGPKLLRLSPGARLFYSKAGPGSLFSTAQIVFDFTGHEAPSGRPLGNDFGVRNANGLWFDRGELAACRGHRAEHEPLAAGRRDPKRFKRLALALARGGVDREVQAAKDHREQHEIAQHAENRDRAALRR